MIKITIPRRSSACNTCSKKFEPGSDYYSLLKDSQRSDFCINCWKASENKGSCFWRSTIPGKKIIPTGNRNEKAAALLKELEDSEEAVRWILALYLCRQKQLFLKQEFQKEGKKYQVYETEDGEAFAIRAMVLSSNQILEIQQKLAPLLR